MIILLLGEVNVFWDEGQARCGTGEVVMKSWGFLLFYAAYYYTVIIDMGRK